MSVDWTKPIQTKDGDGARLVCAIPPVGRSETRVVTLDEKTIRLYYEDGSYFPSGGNPTDIINVPSRKVTRKIEAWAVVDDAGDVVFVSHLDHQSRSVADSVAYKLVRLTGTVEAEVAE